MGNEDEKLTNEELLQVEDSVLKGILGAAQALDEEKAEIIIARNGVEHFRFNIQPLTEREFTDLHEKATKFRRAKNLGGVKVAEETDHTRFRSYVIYQATTKEDRARIWDNKAAWSELEVVAAHHMIDKVLKAGEKERIFEKIEEISGYNESEEDQEDLVKN